MKPKAKYYRAKIISFRSKKNLDPDALREDLHDVMNSLDHNDSMPAQEHYNQWHYGMTTVLNKHMPVKKMRVRESDAPDMTREWKEVIRKKRKYAKRHTKLQTEESDQLRMKWRNIATHLRRNAIKQYWRDKSDDFKTNPRSFFKTFTPFLKDKKRGNSGISLKNWDNIVQDQQEVSELLATYFAHIADKTGQFPSASTTADHPSVTKIKNRWLDNEFHFRKVSRSEVLEALEKLTPHKAIGHDLVSTSVLRMAASEVVSPITSIYNQIIAQGTWPDECSLTDIGWIVISRNVQALSGRGT